MVSVIGIVDSLIYVGLVDGVRVRFASINLRSNLSFLFLGLAFGPWAVVLCFRPYNKVVAHSFSIH